MTVADIRESIVRMCHYSGSSHVGTCLSIADILYVLYFDILQIDPDNPYKPDRDKFILSKGHGSAAFYSVLSKRGFFPKEYLDNYYINNGILPGHLDRLSAPGIEVSAGSLGHGLSIGTGIALAHKRMNLPGKVYVLLGDGECNEGSVWEAAMLASTLGLDNLTAIIDYNRLQGFGKTNEIIDQSNMAERWASFGWDTVEADGHDHTSLEAAFQKEHFNPKAIIAHTVKGNGVSFMENKLEWHYNSLSDEQFQRALREIRGMKP